MVVGIGRPSAYLSRRRLAIHATKWRRTHVVRIFPNAESCLRLVRALAVETHENWLEGTRYLNMQHLAEHKKEALRQAA